ncbi:MAG: sugar ABC transporter substrate-binding protein [Oscillospiraceae bacterium]|nr:sugar ABC transporter substrate-binding protein [Oscillospiraceae bacterium]
MRRMKIIAMLLVLVMAVGFIASCDKPKETTNTSNNDNTASNNDNSAGAPADPTASSGSSGSTGTGALPGGKNIYEDPIKISVISISTAGIVNRMYQMALNDQAVRYPNVILDYKDAEYDPSKQVTLIEEAITQKYDCIILECMDPVGVNEAIDKAEAAGIPVISTNAAEPFTVHSLHVAGADYSSGWKGGEELVKLAGNEGTAVVLDCPASFKPGARMGTGFEDYITQNTNIRLIEQIPIENWDAAVAQTSMRDVLTKYGPGEITMVYCSSGDIANGAMNAIDAAGRADEGILIWGFMGYPMELEAIRDGRMAGTMFSDTYTQYAALFYIALNHIATGLTSITGGYTATPAIEQPMFPVTKDNVDDVMAFSGWYMTKSMNGK